MNWLKKMVEKRRNPKFGEHTVLHTPEGHSVVAVYFCGEAGNSHAHSKTFHAIDNAIKSALQNTHAKGIILDFRDLKYEWGDEMARTLSVTSIVTDSEFPQVVLTSPLNLEALSSLLVDELFEENPRKYLLSEEVDALRRLDELIQEVQPSAGPYGSPAAGSPSGQP